MPNPNPETRPGTRPDPNARRANQARQQNERYARAPVSSQLEETVRINQMCSLRK